MLGKYGAVEVAIPATDTIIKMNLNTHEIEDIPNRQFLYMDRPHKHLNYPLLGKHINVHGRS